MHIVNYLQFFVTLGLSIVTTALISRFILLVLAGRGLGLERVAYANGASLIISWMLFIVWCSTGAKIYWFAGHVACLPQALFFIYDVLSYDGDAAEDEETAAADIQPDL